MRTASPKKLSLLILFFVMAPCMLMPKPKPPKLTTHFNERKHEAAVQKWLRTTSEVIALLEDRSFRHIDFSNFMQTMLKAGVASIDAHSAFIPNFEELAESLSGKFPGIGVSVLGKSNEDDHLLVVDVVDGSPAQKSGILGGDKIVEVGGEKLRGLSADEVVGKIKGKVGSTVRIKLIRDKRPLEFSVTREIIKDQSSCCYHFVEQNVYYLALKSFNEVAPKQMKGLVNKANKGDCKGIVLDLRSNPGGILEVAVEIAQLFIPKGSLVSQIKNRKNVVSKEFLTNEDPILTKKVPIMVLINNFTASAAEILAGTLQHYAQKADAHLPVFVIGTQSFGKGSVQEVIPISNGCALKQTTDLYYLANGTTVQANGIKPDIVIKPKAIPEVELKWIDELYGKETSLKHHITPDEIKKREKGKFPGFAHEIDKVTAHHQREAEQKRTDKEKDGKTPIKSREDEIALNSQIQAAVNLINLYNLAAQATPKEVETREKTLSFFNRFYLSDTPVKIKKVD